jgi:hypothetical protein
MPLPKKNPQPEFLQEVNIPQHEEPVAETEEEIEEVVVDEKPKKKRGRKKVLGIL